MKMVYICSPYKNDISQNTEKAKRYCRYAYVNGYVPYAPHLHNPTFMDEYAERDEGLLLALEMLKRADELWVFGNELTEGMEIEYKMAKRFEKHIRYFSTTCEERQVSSNGK